MAMYYERLTQELNLVFNCSSTELSAEDATKDIDAVTCMVRTPHVT